MVDSGHTLAGAISFRSFCYGHTSVVLVLHFPTPGILPTTRNALDLLAVGPRLRPLVRNRPRPRPGTRRGLSGFVCRNGRPAPLAEDHGRRDQVDERKGYESFGEEG